MRSGTDALRVLLLCDRYPFPVVDGLSLRVYHYVRRLSERHRFDLVCYADRPPADDPLTPSLESCHVFPPPVRPRRQGWQRLAGAVSLADLYPAQPSATARIRELLRARPYDLIWDAGCNMLTALPPEASGVPQLADQVDDIFVTLMRQARVAHGLRRKLSALHLLVQQIAFARQFLARARVCLFVSDVDARVFARVARIPRVAVIANGVDADYFQPPTVEPDPFNLAFEGVMNFPPNVDAAVYLVREIFPMIRATVPQATLTLIGRTPSPEVQALASDRVTVTGMVDDVRPWLARTAVFACPLRSGAGIKNKILQAWAMEKPVVATPESTGGLAYGDSVNVLVRRNPSEFAAAVVGLMRDPAAARKLGTQGRATVLQHYTWEAKTQELERLMMRIAGRTVRPTAVAPSIPGSRDGR